MFFKDFKIYQDSTVWLTDEKAVKDELAAIRSAQAKAKQELKKEAHKWSFNNNYKLA